MTETIEQFKQRAASLLLSPRLTNEHIDAMNNIAWKLRNADIALVAKMSAKALQLSARNDYLRGRASALRIVGTCQLRTDRYQAAKQSYEESHRLFLYLEDNAGVASTINGLGTTRRQTGEYEAALANYSVALQMRQNLNDNGGIADVLFNFGAIHWHLSEYSQSLEYVYRGLQMIINSDAGNTEAQSYCCLGDLLWRVGEAEEAIRYSKKALALFETYPDPRAEGMALVNLGEAQQSLGKHEKALSNYQQSLAIAQNIGNIDTQTEVKIRIGSIYCETSKTKQALTHLSEALSLSQSIGRQFYESQALLHLGTAYRQVGDERESVRMLEEALEISEKLNIKEVRYKAHLSLSKSYQAQGDLVAALYHFQNFHQIWSDCFSIQTGRKVQRLLLEREFVGLSPNKISALLHPKAAWRSNVKTSTSNKATELPPHKLKQVIEFINHHLEQNLTVSEIADVTGLSQNYFLRSFKNSTGKTPHQFLIEQRIERAKSLLTTFLPLAEIAVQCGFSSQSHFNTHFRLLTGIPPGQFRQLLKNNTPK